MTGYKSFGDAVIEAGKSAKKWKYSGDGKIFEKEELIKMSEFYDEKISPDGWNYFVCFEGGEIGLLSTFDNSVELLFSPA